MKRMLGATALALAFAFAVGAGGTEDMPEVKVVAFSKGSGADGKQEIVLRMHITKPWYAYANPVENEILAPNKTVVKFEGKGIVGEPKVQYPAGKEKIDGEYCYRIYEDGAEIKAVLTRAKGENGPLDIKVDVSICHPKGQCLPRKTVPLTVP